MYISLGGGGGGGGVANRLLVFTNNQELIHMIKLYVYFMSYLASSGGCGYQKPLVGVISLHTGPALCPSAPTTTGKLWCTPVHSRVFVRSFCVHSRRVEVIMIFYMSERV